MNVEFTSIKQSAEVGPSAAIAISGLTKSFTPGMPVFSDITLDIEPGSIVALIGANGAGKSTLLRCIPRLIEPDMGKIRVLGSNVLGPSRELRGVRTRIGFVFQKHNLVGRLSALTNVVHGAQARGFGAKAWLQSLAPQSIRKEALHCLGRVGLAAMAAQRADQLSGGQSQRVAIARALMQHDEVMQLFAALMRQEAKTVVFTSHNLSHSLLFADRVIALGGGKIVLDSPSARLRESELRDLYV